MAAAMMNRHGMLRRDLVQVVDSQATSVSHLGVVEEVSFDPSAGRRLAGAFLELLDDAIDGEELDLEWITHHHSVQQDLSLGVVVTIDESWNDCHFLRVENGCTPTSQIADVIIATHRLKSALPDGEGLCTRQRWINRIKIGVDDDHVGSCRSSRGLSSPSPFAASGGGPGHGTGTC